MAEYHLFRDLVLAEIKYCPLCRKEVGVKSVAKPDVDLKICENCGAAVSIRYKDY